MKKLLRLGLFALGLSALVILIAFADGATMPIDHSVSVAGTVAAPPEKVFALITNIAAAPTWRPEVKSVEILPKINGRDAWIEDLGAGQKMKFLAITTAPPAQRVVQLNDPDASYGGTWTYVLTPGPSQATTTITITEDGFIKPVLYRFMMARVFGPTRNLQDYLNHLTARASKAS